MLDVGRSNIATVDVQSFGSGFLHSEDVRHGDDAGYFSAFSCWTCWSRQ